VQSISCLCTTYYKQITLLTFISAIFSAYFSFFAVFGLLQLLGACMQQTSVAYIRQQAVSCESPAAVHSLC